ncbi:MAG: ribonuclease HII [Thermoplasmata archaeon]
MGERSDSDRTDSSRLVLGVDEAGRGCVLGPLVVGGFVLREDRIPELTYLGVRDSKLLAPAKREAVYADLLRTGACHSIPLQPREIDQWVARGKLNDLEAEAFALIARRSQAALAIVDSCDPVPRRFGRRIRRLAGVPIQVISAHHADRDYPIVGAASIIAKVRRDRALRELEAEVGGPLGSGYPSDPATVSFLRETLRKAAHPPSWVRSSWATTERVMAERSARTLDEFGP